MSQFATSPDLIKLQFHWNLFLDFILDIIEDKRPEFEHVQRHIQSKQKSHMALCYHIWLIDKAGLDEFLTRQ
jgi:hypothetical protein